MRKKQFNLVEEVERNTNMRKKKFNFMGGGNPTMRKDTTQEPIKDPILACLLNLLFLGTGHMYLGKIVKGILILVLGVGTGMIVWPVSILIIIWAMYDAYKSAKKENQAIRTSIG